MGVLGRLLSRWRDDEYRCWCGALVEKRFGFCSEECRHHWQNSTAY